MKTYKYVVTCSKSLISVGFADENTAKKYAEECVEQFSTGINDIESHPTVFSWEEWVRIANENELDAYGMLDNAVLS